MAERPLPEVHLLRLALEDLVLAHAGVERDGDDWQEVSVLRCSGGSEQTSNLVLGEKTKPSFLLLAQPDSRHLLEVAPLLGRYRSNRTPGSALAPGDGTVEFEEKLFYVSRSGAVKTGGVYIAGFSSDGLVVALCSVDGQAQEMRVESSASTGKVGKLSLTRISTVRTVYGTLIEAAMKDDMADIQRHIQNGADLNALFDMGPAGGVKGSFTSILHFLGYHGHEQAIEALLDAGADPNIKDSNGNPPLESAVAGNHPSIVKCLITHGADVNARLHPGQYADLGVVGIEGNTPLHSALLLGHEEIARLLVKNGANLTVKNGKGLSPLQIAQASGLGHVLA